MSSASDIEEHPQTFSARCFYSTKRPAYVTPLERKEQQLPKRPPIMLDMDKKLTGPAKTPIHVSVNCTHSRADSNSRQRTKNLRKARNSAQNKLPNNCGSRSTLTKSVSNKTELKSSGKILAKKKHRASPVKGLRKSVQLYLRGTMKGHMTDHGHLRTRGRSHVKTGLRPESSTENLKGKSDAGAAVFQQELSRKGQNERGILHLDTTQNESNTGDVDWSFRVQVSSLAPKNEDLTVENESRDDLLNKIDGQPQQKPHRTAPNKKSCDGLAMEIGLDEQVETETPDSSAHCVKVSPRKAAVMMPSFVPPPVSLSSKKKTSTPYALATSLLRQRRLHIMNKMNDSDGLEQMTMDLGQKYFGATSCETCGMVYTASHPEDETSHDKFHRKYVSSVKFPGWKNERLLQEFDDGRVLMVLHDDPKYHIKKVEEIRQLVDQELGFLQGDIACKTSSKVFLYITLDKKVSGCLIAEEISKGYRVIADEVKPRGLKELAEFEKQRAWCCETDPIPAVCGVSRIWVASQKRRQGIATRLLDCMRNFFLFGSILAKDSIAFSDPTPDGKMLATSYMKMERFLVYKYMYH